jgi:hypothetical protein
LLTYCSEYSIATGRLKNWYAVGYADNYIVSGLTMIFLKRITFVNILFYKANFRQYIQLTTEPGLNRNVQIYFLILHPPYKDEWNSCMTSTVFLTMGEYKEIVITPYMDMSHTHTLFGLCHLSFSYIRLTISPSTVFLQPHIFQNVLYIS